MFQNKFKLMALTLALGIAGTAFSQVHQVQPPKPVSSVDTTVADETSNAALDNIPIVALDESDGNDANVQNVSTQANSYRDVFYNAASYNWSLVHFRLRGYNSDLSETYMNGVPMESLDNGFTPFGVWGGLNTVARTSQNAPGLQANKFAYGGIGGAKYIDTRASKQRKQTNLGYALSNRNYMHRFSLSHSTGFNKKGWAFSVAGSRRWAAEGFTDGTYYDSWSGYAGIDKKIGSKHLLSLVAMYAPTENGRQGTTVQEMYQITGDNSYNPLWGYQNGKKRNASVTKTNEPLFILTHEWKINKKSSLVTAASCITGTRSITGLDWYNAPDPRPDYYRYLPSYYSDEPSVYNAVLTAFRNDVNTRQINWDHFFDVNRNSFEKVYNVSDGSLLAAGNRSHYIVEERFTKTQSLSFNSTYNRALSAHVDLTAGVTYQAQKNSYYKKVNDLLGGDFYVNANQFAERDNPANPYAGLNDLNNFNTIVHKGDIFGYNYDINISKASGWAQSVFKFKKLDFFLGGEYSQTSFYRVGNYASGLFPNDSYGKSDVYTFNDYALKGGVSYKLNYRNYFYVNAANMTKAPHFEKAYLSPRTRDFVQDNLKSETISSIEGGYEYTSPVFKFRATGYYTKFQDAIDEISFYDDLNRTFGNFSISNIDKTHFGGEFGSEVLLYKGISLNAAAAIGRFRYTDRPHLIETLDNTSTLLASDVSYAKNFYVPTPQEAYTAGIQYRSRNYWSVGLNFNYFDQMYANFNPERRTYSAVEGVLDNTTKQWHSIIDQTKLSAQYTVDMHANWSYKLKKPLFGMHKTTFLLLNLTVNNIADNRNVAQNAFEQLRYDFENKNPDKFPMKISYAYGLNFNLSVGLRF